ncbi:MAG: carbohydrate-binding domain-containing protein, partial [Clostridia bacterium]|nr:carbohydrate-binding domain-containing protein [Clostridia bacterium]
MKAAEATGSRTGSVRPSSEKRKGSIRPARFLTVLTALFLAGVLASCEAAVPSGNPGTGTDTAAEPAVDTEITAREAEGDFTLTTEDGTYSRTDTGYTITSAGTYTASGLLEGQITVEAGEEDEVVLELSGATVSCDRDSPIKVLSAGKAEISAKKGTENVINDNRAAKTAETDFQGEGAVYADCDLKIKGNGKLVVNASYHNGIH